MTRAALLLAALLSSANLAADVVDVRQGTNIAVAVDPDGGTLLVDLLGGLWRLPVTGGGATMLMSPGSGIAQPRLDPAGRRAVVERYTDGQWDLWLLELASGTWSRLTESRHAERQPDFLPDGSGIVFASDRSGRDQLWTLELATGALRQLTDEPGDSRFPAVSADGTIAYVNQQAGLSSLRILDTGPAGRAIETGRSLISAPSWRPGTAGPVLVYNARDTDSSDLAMLIDADIRIDRQLTHDEDVFVGRVAWLDASEFIYAADGQLWRRGIGSSERRPVHMFAGVQVDPVDTRSTSSLFGEPGPHPAAGIRDFRRSGDGRAAVFAALGDIWYLRNRELQRLTDDAAVDTEPVLLPDGERIVFLSDRSGSFDVWQADVATGSLSPVAATRGDSANLLVTGDGHTAYFTTVSEPGDGAISRVERAALSANAAVATLAGPFNGMVRLVPDGQTIAVLPREDGDDVLQHLHVESDMLPLNADPPDPDALGEFDALQWMPLAGEPAVIQAGRLFDGIRNEYRRHVDIHIVDGRIVDIVARDRMPAAGRIIDFSDATVIPGMIDVHAHHPDNTPQSVGYAWLLRGVTTVREIATNPAAAMERAEAWASGRRPGPRLVVTSSGRAEAGGLQGAQGFGPIADGAISSGFLHTLATPAGLPADAPIENAGHLPGAGLATPLSPLNRTYQDTLAILGGSGGYLSTGLTAALARIGSGDARRHASGQLTAIVERAQRSFGRVAIGSDAPLVPYGDGFIGEIETLVRAGIPPEQVLRWATAGGAMALGLDRVLGTLEAGKLADLVVIDGDPLSRTGDLRRVVMVMQGGTIVSGNAQGPPSTRQRP